MWPHCLQRLEGVSPEVDHLWLSHVREARPVYRHGWRTASMILALPVTGAIGWLLLIWRSRIDREQLRRILAAAAPGFAAPALLFWQTRTGPAAQMLAVARRGRAGVDSGAVLLVVEICGGARSGRGGGVLIGLGAAVPLVVDYVPTQEEDAGRGGGRQGQPPVQHPVGLSSVALQPKGSSSPSSTSGRG